MMVKFSQLVKASQLQSTGGSVQISGSGLVSGSGQKVNSVNTGSTQSTPGLLSQLGQREIGKL
ncbi:hypothetical protein HanPSC8_Chr17g0779571 [Helianthus annuus]|nr:hypothetical protein HanPSC8_Chr17g0779571 [Helianthus annuus]